MPFFVSRMKVLYGIYGINTNKVYKIEINNTNKYHKIL